MIYYFMFMLCMRHACAVPARNAISASYYFRERTFSEVAHIEAETESAQATVDNVHEMLKLQKQPTAQGVSRSLRDL